ncbi:Phosphoprotein_phosphatase 2A regulatory subunit [Hexamita inflata]|uniref:Phosphoprotein phosphatase 2A regulatory subunit n=2 Tax=Hexamita inflata TaxID=28002 RepID=A0AA86PSN3_9EUKA|nr:Phosphoprotein phosphatase 2A regulatory subunit [Hexamita inflata]
MRKALKIDLQSKPIATPEDQAMIFQMFGDNLQLQLINTTVYAAMIKNYSTEMLSGEPVNTTTHYTIPESPSRRTAGEGQKQFPSVLSPRTILSPSYNSSGGQQEFPAPALNTTQQAGTNVVLRPIQNSKSTTVKELIFPRVQVDQDEIDVLDSICERFPDGVNIHTTGKHPNYIKASALTKKGRTQFEQDEEIRVINDIFFEGVLGLPGFLAWNALPLALAHYQGDFTVPFMADQLLQYGETITQMFVQNTNKKFILTPKTLKTWYQEQFQGKSTHERLFNALKQPGADMVTINDLQRISQILLKLHPGLAFLNDTPQFQVLYAQTVAWRILIENDTNLKGYLTVKDLKKIQGQNGTEFSADNGAKQGGLLDALWQSQYESDINKNLKCFSYEHFYVFYVTFWELDQDRDRMITLTDLERYAGGSIGKLALKRAFDLIVQIRQRNPTPYEAVYTEKMNKKPTPQELSDFLAENKLNLFYQDFIRFLIYLENPDLDVSCDFWFEVADLDCDGVISFNDFQVFFKQIREKMETNGADLIDSADVYCQMVDFYKSKRPNGAIDLSVGAITAKDIKKSQSRGNIYSVMFHFQRFQQFDMKDPYTIRNFAIQEKSLWERFCRRQYDIQVQGVSGDGY